MSNDDSDWKEEAMAPQHSGRNGGDDGEDEVSRKVHRWEQHGTSIFMAIATAGIIGMSSMIWSMRDTQTAQAASLMHMSSKLGEVQEELRALRSNMIGRTEFSVHEGRIQRLEDKIINGK